MKTLLKKVCSLILALLMVLSVVSVPTFSAKAEDGENPPSTMTLNEALNVEGGNIEFTNSGDYIDSENGNYIWRVEDDHIASPEVDRYEKRQSSLRKSPQPRATSFLLTSFAMFPTRHMCTEVCFSASMTYHRRAAKDTDMPAFMTGRIRSMRSQPESTH